MTTDSTDSTLGSPDSLSRELSPEFEKAALQLVVDGFRRWQSGGFQRVGDYENHFTIRLVACMNDIRRERNMALIPRYQYVEPTDEMLAGREDPDRVPCIDIVISSDLLTQDAYLSIECKRLAPDDLARLYVVCGINRFVRGYYGAKTQAGGMVGYVIRGTPSAALMRVNSYVSANRAMGPQQALMQTNAVGWLSTVFESNHARTAPYQAIRLTHLFFDMKDIGPPH